VTDDNIERGAMEDASDTPVTPIEVDASRTPPSQGPRQPDGDDPVEARTADGESRGGYDVESVSGDTELYRPE
jgi:hypothetical protein